MDMTHACRLKIFAVILAAPLVVAAIWGGGTAALARHMARPAPKSESLLVPSQLEKGRWTLTARNSASPVRRLCLGDSQQLVQVEHGHKACAQYIIENTPNVLTVHYSCEGAGNGRTTIRRETNRLVQIDTQGVHKGRLFDDHYEARRTGACTR